MIERVAIIGGTGLYEMQDFEDVREVEVETPFGPPSDRLIIGRRGNCEVVFLSRHGRGHRLLPSEVPFRANIYALKALGVRRVFAVSAVGSMREEIEIGTPVLVDQFVDMTKGRTATFFGNGIVAHVSLADPVCPALREHLESTARRIGMKVRGRGTYLCIEGPQFSTRAESLIYRGLGVDVIGMTNATEARLAREAELCFATIALPTDYDCWHHSHEDVNVEAVIETLKSNIAKARTLVREAISELGKIGPCSCQNALQGAILTDPTLIDENTKKRLGLIISKYIG